MFRGGMVLALAGVSVCFGQEFDQTRVVVTFTGDGAVEARVSVDVDAMLADQPYRELTEDEYAALEALSDEEIAAKLEALRGYLRVRVLLKFDGTPAETVVRFPECEVEEGEAAGRLPGNYFVVRAEVPEDAEAFVFTASPIFFNVFLMTRVEGEERGVREVLLPGGESTGFWDFRDRE